ncbi:hypothetical protein [Nocardioides sp. Root190]|nr:hypothetical protein [Nocardioides sp. Root190]
MARPVRRGAHVEGADVPGELEAVGIDDAMREKVLDLFELTAPLTAE